MKVHILKALIDESKLYFLCFHRPEGDLYQMFRDQFLAYNLYQSKTLLDLLLMLFSVGISFLFVG